MGRILRRRRVGAATDRSRAYRADQISRENLLCSHRNPLLWGALNAILFNRCVVFSSLPGGVSYPGRKCIVSKCPHLPPQMNPWRSKISTIRKEPIAVTALRQSQ
jgi:hypothetical protein